MSFHVDPSCTTLCSVVAFDTESGTMPPFVVWCDLDIFQVGTGGEKENGRDGDTRAIGEATNSVSSDLNSPACSQKMEWQRFGG